MAYLNKYRRRDLIDRFVLCAERLRELDLTREDEALLGMTEQHFNSLIVGHSGDFSSGCLVLNAEPICQIFTQIFAAETMLTDQQDMVGDLGYRPLNAAHREALLRRWDERFPGLRTRRDWTEVMIETLLPL